MIETTIGNDARRSREYRDLEVPFSSILTGRNDYREQQDLRPYI